MKKCNYIIAALILVCGFVAAKESYYSNPEPLFSKRPDPGKSLTHLTNFGPVGMSLDLLKPDFTIRIKSL